MVSSEMSEHCNGYSPSARNIRIVGLIWRLVFSTNLGYSQRYQSIYLFHRGLLIKAILPLLLISDAYTIEDARPFIGVKGKRKSKCICICECNAPPQKIKSS
jgi:hypothetical protein